MDNVSHILLSSKLLQVCGEDIDTTIYSLLPNIDYKPEYFKEVYAHNIENCPKILFSGINILTGEKTKIANNSYEMRQIKEEKENIISSFEKAKNILFKDKLIKISKHPINAALSLISHMYFDTFTQPVHFFIPYSSFCSGQWDLWNKFGYLNIKRKFYSEEVDKFREKIKENKIWSIKFKEEDFLPIIRKRLKKENLFEEKLQVENLIKAIIIRMGELTNPQISYEVVDYSIRYFLRNLNINKYLRVDREIEFCRRLEEEIIKNLIE